jgi:hypothetical protein
MRNVMLFVAIIFVGLIGYQLAAPYLSSKGIDMNATAIEDTDVESH